MRANAAGKSCTSQGGGREARGGTKPATPVPPLVLLALRCARTQRSDSLLRCSVTVALRVHARFRANPRICGISRALACKRGVATCMNACHPHILLAIGRCLPPNPGLRGLIGPKLRSASSRATRVQDLSRALFSNRTRGGTPPVSGVPPRASLPPRPPCTA